MKKKSDDFSLASLEKTRGYILESHKVLMANDPDFLGKYDQLYKALLAEENAKALPIPMKELIVIALLASKGEHPPLELHIRRALKLGAGSQEILEALELTMFYSGAPSMLYGIESLEKVAREMGEIDAKSRRFLRKSKKKMETASRPDKS
jgi:alkylhydroperoxidase/carboxymuconolactone decarboxylase family protein YurZ